MDHRHRPSSSFAASLVVIAAAGPRLFAATMITEPVPRPLGYIGASGPRIASCGPNTDVGGPGLLADTGAFPMLL
jgi:hypothetical protein